MPLALWALTLSAFAIGTTEFVIVGLVPTIAADLGVSLPSAGLLVSLYAVGVAIGAPILTALTGRWNRKIVLMSLMGLFVVGNLLAWQAPSYETLILARILTGLAHGVFFSIGSMIATSLVSKEKEASAIAIMFTGLTVALVTGVPLGTWIGQHFGWRATFLVVSVLGLIALIGSAILVPKNLKKSIPATFKEQLQVIVKPQLLLVYLMTILGYGGTFTAFTYLAPILEQQTKFAPSAIGLIMLVYGVSVAIGNIWGGKLADKRGPISALSIIFSALSVILLLFTFTMQSKIAAVLTILVWGAFAFGNVPGLQIYVVKQAEKYTPNAVDVASGLNIAAFNIGIALGSIIGGSVVENMSLQDTAWIGAVISLMALAVTRYSGLRDKRALQAS
ncbi:MULTISPECIES: MFS transporter [Psychrobacter]|jgi:predicted MFS family arabinose efflux permease|uniref:MFS transporter n=1 Tax=Psychrobacter TaxID=497 RepID=UPI00086F5DDB|nr:MULTISPECIES: MFS transporter [Psychrobacter]MBA6245569.1 MFS transporter [Psychrobacter sp. Urea-trap-18]MBA6284984.1 MFS transporter [Psychrobacter sp. Urea-trap-16]MBA6317068.1 MFS transporter [Psychrobacter sp. Urea-trap-20]MBA6333196.1 MFS transporter [Psychrobacter sp. Urea-trap-19]OEH67102.1 MAG: MFS sugar transporter [Psychrobacter sp. B29-1]|tara:strand:+ start:58439 stop:59611 length:1173 start_codon:yes stop_codon:yes gene_type:complete